METVANKVDGKLSPVAQQDRHHSLDLIRGIAVLGILIMNISAFANIFAYYLNPKVLGEPSQIDLYTWMITHILADQKFYTIFSMLFGAGIMLMAEKAKQKEFSPAKLHYKRMFWLFCFGLIHALLIWFGDILVTYAFAGCIVFLFANTQPKTKLIVGSVFIGIMLLMMQSFVAYMDMIPPQDVQEMKDMFAPSQQMIADEMLPYTTSYMAQLDERLEFFGYNLGNMIFFGPFRIGGAMLIGMALFQLGIFTAQRSRAFYSKFAIINLLIGGALLYWDVSALFAENFSMKQLMHSYMVINSLAAVFVALGYIGLFCLWVQCDLWSWLKAKLQAVGRMAFTNYITQSLICTTIFYSYGFGLYAELERYQLYFVVYSSIYGSITLLRLVVKTLSLWSFRVVMAHSYLWCQATI